jgi:hypothetical protein
MRRLTDAFAMAVLSAAMLGVPACLGAGEAERDRLAEVCRFADNLIKHARDHYGPKKTPLFVCQLDVDSKSLLPADSKLYATADRGGAGPTMNNLQFDSAKLRLLYALSKRTGNSKYAEAADEYLRYYLANLPDPKTGFFPWGDHLGYDVVTDETITAVHEFKCTWPAWEEMYRINPEAVTRQIEALKRHIIDESKSYGFNRHCPPGEQPHSMNSSGGAYIAAWAFLYRKTGDKKYLDWADRMSDYLWSLRNPSTDLLAAHPYDPAYPEMAKSEYNAARAARTEYMGQVAWFGPNLLRASILLGPEEGNEFRDRAIALFRGMLSRMDIQPDGSFYATFDLATGKPLLPRVREPWQWQPQLTPPINWSNGVIACRVPSSVAFAYKVTDEPEFREMFDRSIRSIDLKKFENLDGPPQPISAGALAEVIVGLLNMDQGSGDKSYLDRAELLCRYAMVHFYRNGWFVCGVPPVPRYRDPNVDVWRTYSNRGGSDALALAVLRAWLAANGHEDTIEDDPAGFF